MKNSGYELLRKGQLPLLIATGLAPSLFYTYADKGLDMAWLIPCCYLFFAWVGLKLPRVFGWIWGTFGALGILLLGSLFYEGVAPFLWVAGFAAALLLGVPVAQWSWDEELPNGFCWAGLAIHAVCYFLVFRRDFEGDPLPDATVWGIGLCFLCYGLLMLLRLNRSALSSAALGRHRADPTVRRRNRLLVLIFFLATGLIAFTPVLPGLLYRGFRWLLGLLTKWAEKPADPNYAPVEDITFPGDYVPETVVIPEHSAVDRLNPGGTPWASRGDITPLLWVFFGLVAVLFLLSVPVLLRLLAKLLKKLSQPAEDGYVDEVTSLRPDRQKQSKLPGTQKERPGRLSPRWKIRRRYARLMKKNRWGSSRTARENLHEEAAALYEQARYSGAPISAQQAEQFLKETK